MAPVVFKFTADFGTHGDKYHAFSHNSLLSGYLELSHPFLVTLLAIA